MRPDDEPAVIDIRGQLPTRQGARPYYIRSWAKDPFEPTDDELAAARARIVGMTVHYTASNPAGTPEDIARYQVGPEPRDAFPAVAYTFLVTADGTIYRCHDIETRTWHSGVVVGGVNRNEDHVGVGWIGNHSPTRAQVRALRQVRQTVEAELGRRLLLEGHRDAPGAATLCPGPTWEAWRAELD